MPKPVPLPEQLEKIEAYASYMGVSAQACLNEAIEDWLTIVAAARISQCEKPDNLVAFKVARKA